MNLGPNDRPSDDHASPAPAAGQSGAFPGGSPRVLIVSTSPDRLNELARAVRASDAVCTLATSIGSALEILEDDVRRAELRVGASRPRVPGYEVVVYDLARCSGPALRFVRDLGDRSLATMIVCPDVSFDEAVQAMRAGACDIVSGVIKPRELSRRLRSVVQQRRATAQQRLAGEANAELGAGEHEALGPSTPMTSGPRGADALVAGKVNSNPMSADETLERGFARPSRARRIADARHDSVIENPEESVRQFASMIRGELDVESLLRQALEFVLAQAGPTNAAVFLPAHSGDYTLGAYVNFSCPKETVEVLLDHLANVAAPALESAQGVLELASDEDFNTHAGLSPDWLSGSRTLAFACHHQGECLAVFMLFRDQPAGFSPQVVEVCGRLSSAFGEQLARVVRIHHRHLPRDKWGAVDRTEDDHNDADSGGMAA
jgi:DNA-binding response OmpR family regulator